MSSITSPGVKRVPTDSGTAIPVGGTLEILGAGGITTSASGDTVTITGSSGANSFPTNSGTAAPLAGVLNVVGDGGGLITTSGAGNTVTINADYSHGTWTPSITWGGSITGISYTSRIGEYVKIGQTVFINYYIVLASKGPRTGIARLEGFPFSNSGALAPNHVYSGGLLLTFDAGYTYGIGF